MKTALIAPIGTSAPVVTEMVMHINGLEGMELTDVVVMPTRDELVMAHATLARVALKHRYGRMRVHLHPLPFRDIGSTGDTVEFMRIAAKLVAEERRVHGCERVYLSIAGGRKDVCVSLAIVGQIMGADGVFHVINPEVRVINEQLERLRERIFELHRAPEEEKGEVYGRYREDFESVMFPPIERLRYVQIPCIPYPEDYIGRIGTLLNTSGRVRIERTGLEMRELKRLERAGMVRIVGDEVAVTEFGEMVGRIWR